MLNTIKFLHVHKSSTNPSWIFVESLMNPLQMVLSAVQFQFIGTDNYVGAIITVTSLGVLNIVYMYPQGGIQLSSTTATKILGLTTMLDAILYIIGMYNYIGHNIISVNHSEIAEQKVCFSGLIRIHTCNMLDLVGTCSQYGPNNW